jgi:1,4-alpha-glucan branching enzyme
MKAIQNHSNGTDYSAKNSLRPVNFYCAAPEAKKVEITGDFNHWRPFPMNRLLDGWWFVRLELCHGHHQYRFIVDGKTLLDPNAIGSALNERNERVSLIAVS